jgi:hypothetical protein
MSPKTVTMKTVPNEAFMKGSVVAFPATHATREPCRRPARDRFLDDDLADGADCVAAPP